MAIEYVITTQSDDERRVSGFAYSVVPVGNNEASISWSLALTQYLGDTTAKAPALPAGVTQAELDLGVKYEWAFSAGVNPGDLPGVKETRLKEILVLEEPGIISTLQTTLEFWGREGVTV